MESSTLPLPAWMLEVDQAAYSKMKACRFLHLVHGGDLEALRYLVWLFWPIVDRFPRDINNACRAVIKHLGRGNSGFRTMALSFHKTPHDLIREYAGDESEHRQYWLAMGQHLKVSLQPNDTSTEDVKQISEALKDRTDLARLCYRLIGVEVVAEQLTAYLMESELFKAHLPGNSLDWFSVHQPHPDAFHTVVGLKLAEEVSGGAIDANIAQSGILETVDMFTAASVSFFSEKAA